MTSNQQTRTANRNTDVALQHFNVSSRRTHSRHSKTLKHAAHLETRLTLQAAHTHHVLLYYCCCCL